MNHAAALLLASCCSSLVLAGPFELAQRPSLPVGHTTDTAGPLVLTTSYESTAWSGTVVARRIDATNGTLAVLPTWDSAAGLDAAAFDPGKRVVLSHSGKVGIAFRWPVLGSSSQALLAGPDGPAAGSERLDYVRGRHGAEAVNGGTLRSRTGADGRPFRQGDIVHSQAWFTGAPAARIADAGYAAFRARPEIATRPAMVYVGGNDGMLHGFDAGDGQERLAYVPRGVIPWLRAFTGPAWSHRYLVDGSAFTGDADIQGLGTGSRWATVLVGSPGAGARGYFVLDASLPQAFSEADAAGTVLLDTTATSDPDIGHIVAEPVAGAAQIVRLNNGRWAALLGNGVGSPGEMPVLLLQYLDGSRELVKLAPRCAPLPAACAWRGKGNGLATPMSIDIDGDGTADIAYAGDLLGHVWKFDLVAGDAAKWKVAFGGAPLFSAEDANGEPQPVVSALAWMPHPRGGVMLAVGTGRLPTLPDAGETSARLSTQTLYGLHDDSSVGIQVVASASDRQTRTYVGLHDGTPINSASDPSRPTGLTEQRQAQGTTQVQGHDYYRTASSGAGQYSLEPRGWFFDLPGPAENVMHAPAIFAGQKVLFRSTGSEQDYITVLNLITGLPSAAPVFAAVAALSSDTVDSIGIAQGRASSRVSVAAGGLAPATRGNELRLLAPSQAPLVLLKGNGKGQRAGWRQLP